MYAQLKVRPFDGDRAPSWSRPWVCFRFSLNRDVAAIRNAASRAVCCAQIAVVAVLAGMAQVDPKPLFKFRGPSRNIRGQTSKKRRLK
jgi:hypothetical protein